MTADFMFGDLGLDGCCGGGYRPAEAIRVMEMTGVMVFTLEELL